MTQQDVILSVAALSLVAGFIGGWTLCRAYHFVDRLVGDEPTGDAG